MLYFAARMVILRTWDSRCLELRGIWKTGILAADVPKRKNMENKIMITLSAAIAIFASAAASVAAVPGAINMGELVDTTGKTDVSAAIQRVIDANPNRTLYFPDGTYLLANPICTPAHPEKSVDLQLSNFAVLKASPEWTSNEAMVRLGAIHRAKNIRTPGSCYSMTGGIVDGSGKANGVAIESGRETKVRCVSMKNVFVGLHIKYGANNGSSDCDISDVNIVGNRMPGSTGVILEGHDNTLSNMRIADVQVGVRLRSNTNMLTSIHPLYTNPMDQYDGSAGFEDRGFHNSYDRCYSDHFSTGFFFGRQGGFAVLRACVSYWYAPCKGKRHTAIGCERKFTANVSDMHIGFNGTEAVNTVLETRKEGGCGYIRDIRMDERLLNEKSRQYLKYVR